MQRVAAWLAALALSVIALPGAADPLLDATLTDEIAVDVDEDGELNPGDTLEYRVTVTNTGDIDAVNVHLLDVLGANTELVAGSLNVFPRAADDMYMAIGNTPRMVVDAADGLLANDVDVDDPVGLSVESVDDALTQGTVVVAADGSFDYTPPPGVTNLNDSFAYTVTDGRGGTDTASVAISVQKLVWYVDNRVAPGGDGSQGAPFAALADAVAAAGAGDTIFLFEGSGVTGYDTGIVLANDQALRGQGSALEELLDGEMVTLVPAAGRPVVTNPAGVGVVLAQNNLIDGLDIGSPSHPVGGRGLVGTNPGNAFVSNASATAVGGAAVDIDGGTLSLSFDSLSSNASSGAGIDLSNASGSFSVSGLTSVSSPSGPGIRLQSNTAAVQLGPLDVTNTGNTGLLATGGGTLTVAGSGSTIDTTNGSALHISNTLIGAAGITFESLSASNASNGIVLDTTGSTGSFTVTGTDMAGTGGTIRDMTGANATTAGIGIRLSQVSNVSFAKMQLNDFSNFAIHGSGVSGFSLSDTVIDGSNGDSSAHDEGAVRFEGLTGSASLTGNDISGGLEDNLLVRNTTGVLDRLTVSGGTIGLNSTALGNDGILVESKNAATLKLTVSGVTFTGARGDMVQCNALDNSTLDCVLRDNAFHNTHPNIVSGGGGITISGGSASSSVAVTYDISGTTPGAQSFRGAEGNAITVNFVNGTGNATGTVRNNAIGAQGAPGSGSASGSGISVGASATVRHTTTIDNNTVREVKGFAGIDLTGNTDSALNATVTNNTVVLSADGSNNFSLAALYALVGGAGTETGTLCLDLRGNTLDASGAPFSGNAVFFDQISASANHNLPGYSAAGNGEFAFACAPGAASAGISPYLGGRGNSLVNGPFPSFFGGGVDATIVCGVTGSGGGCP